MHLIFLTKWTKWYFLIFSVKTSGILALVKDKIYLELTLMFHVSSVLRYNEMIMYLLFVVVFLDIEVDVSVYQRALSFVVM